MNVDNLSDKALKAKFNEVCARQDRAMSNAAWISDEKTLDKIRDEMEKRKLSFD